MENTIYQFEKPASTPIDRLDASVQSDESMNTLNVRAGEIFVNIETRKMTYFSKEVMAVYLRDVSKTVSIHWLNKTNDKKRDQI